MSHLFLSCTLLFAAAQAAFFCPLLGPDFPPPLNLSAGSATLSAGSNFTQQVRQLINNQNSTYGPFDANTTSFSVNIFSVHKDNPIFQYHYSAPILATSTGGVKTVDENSVYRIGSVSKLFTVYAFLVENGDVHWNEPITKYVPELAALAKTNDVNQRNPIDNVAWEDITVGSLASHMAGIGRDCVYFGHLFFSDEQY
jgi:CubicO group peptidase (beta-lactamase class C family)